MKYLKQAVVFFKESKQELLKVNWPSRKDVLRDTLVVISSVFLITLLVAGFDILLLKLVQFFVIK